MIVHPVLFVFCQILSLFIGGLIVFLIMEYRTRRNKADALEQVETIQAGLEGRARTAGA